MILAFVLPADSLTAPIAQLVERPLLEQEVVPHHTKGVKNGTSSSLADARIKWVLLGRSSKAGKYLLKRYCYVIINF